MLGISVGKYLFVKEAEDRKQPYPDFLLKHYRLQITLISLKNKKENLHGSSLKRAVRTD